MSGLRSDFESVAEHAVEVLWREIHAKPDVSVVLEFHPGSRLWTARVVAEEDGAEIVSGDLYETPADALASLDNELLCRPEPYEP